MKNRLTRLVVGEITNIPMTRGLIAKQTSFEMTPVDDDVEMYYEERIAKVKTLDELIEVFTSLVDNRYNIVSYDGIRVFSAQAQLQILKNIRDNNSQFFWDPVNFNRTLGIRQKLLDILSEQTVK